MPTSAQRRVNDPILSTVVQGYKHPEHVGIFLFPAVPVAVSGGKVIEFDKAAFRLYNTLRAPGSATKRITFGYQGKPYSLENHALEAAVPREHLRDASMVPGIDLGSRAVNNVMRVESLVLENDQATIARNLTNYDANHKVTLSGTAQWNDYANSDPIGDVKAGREAVRSSTGVYPNVIEISALVMAKLSEHPNILDKIKYTQRGVVTAELLAILFEVDRVVIGKAIGFADDDTTIEVWGKDVVMAYVPTNPSGMEEPSYGYTYTMQGHPAVEVPYWDPNSKSWIYGVANERDPVLSGIASGFIIKNAVA